MRYNRILTRLYNQPLAIAQSKLDVITSEVTLRLLANERPSALEAIESVTALENSNVINVFDTLVSKNGVGDSGSTSYESVTRQINQAISTGQQKLIFYVDSPGGEVSGLFALAAFISSLPEKHGVETIAVTDGMATSAAYVIASATQKVFATPSAMLGSIGVIMTLVNVSEADKKAGVQYTILRSKDKKALLNPHDSEFTSSAIEDAVKMLSSLDVMMSEIILSSRKNLTQEVIDGLAGSTVLAEEALSLNLIDGIVDSIEDVIQTNLTPTRKKDNNMTLEEALVKNIELSSELENLKKSSALEVAKARVNEQNRVLGILEAAETFKLCTEMAVKRIKAGASVEDSVEMFESVKEMLQISNSLDTSIGFCSSINESLIPKEKSEDFLDTFMDAVDKIQSHDMYKGVR